MDERLGQLPKGNVALGDEHRAAHPGPSRVGRRGGGGVAGRGANDGLDPLLGGFGDGHRHPPVLERAGRVRSLELEQHIGTDPLRQPRSGEQGRPTLQQRHHRGRRRDWEETSIFLDHSSPGDHPDQRSGPMTRNRTPTRATTSNPASDVSVA